MKEIIDFKSIPKFFEKEKNGLKPNTIRKAYFGIDRIYKDKERFQKLDDFEQGKLSSLNIRITNTATKEFFIRKIKDVSIFGSLYIISWTHPVN